MTGPTLTVTGDLREFVAGALKGSKSLWRGRWGTPAKLDVAAEAVLAALAAAGLAVVPAAGATEEWGCRRTERWGGTIAGPMWKFEALSFAAVALDDVVAVVRRKVYYGPWETASAAEIPGTRALDGPGSTHADNLTEGTR